MARKKQTRKVRKPEPAPPPSKLAPTTGQLDVLLDWRVSLAALVVLELAVIAFFLPREIQLHRERVARRALLSGNYERAEDYYRRLQRKEPANPEYLKALGDVALGRGQPTTAIGYYRRAAKQGGARNLDVQRALAYHQLAVSTRDSERRQEVQQRSAQFLRQAYSAAPKSLKVNYARGRMALESLALVEAAEYFSRVREDTVPLGREPDEEQEILIDKAQTQLSQIVRTLLGEEIHPLNLEGLDLQPPPPPSPAPTPQAVPDVATTPPAAMPLPTTGTLPTSRPDVAPPAVTPAIPEVAPIPAPETGAPTSPAGQP